MFLHAAAWHQDTKKVTLALLCATLCFSTPALLRCTALQAFYRNYIDICDFPEGGLTAHTSVKGRQSELNFLPILPLRGIKHLTKKLTNRSKYLLLSYWANRRHEAFTPRQNKFPPGFHFTYYKICLWVLSGPGLIAWHTNVHPTVSADCEIPITHKARYLRKNADPKFYQKWLTPSSGPAHRRFRICERLCTMGNSR